MINQLIHMRLLVSNDLFGTFKILQVFRHIVSHYVYVRLYFIHYSFFSIFLADRATVFNLFKIEMYTYASFIRWRAHRQRTTTTTTMTTTSTKKRSSNFNTATQFVSYCTDDDIQWNMRKWQIVESKNRNICAFSRKQLIQSNE